MPKDGAPKRRSVKTTGSTRSKVKPPREPITRDHHRADLWAAAVAGLGLILFIVLLTGAGGFLGGGITGTVVMLFGRGSWVVAVGLLAAGGLMLIRQSTGRTLRVFLGVLLVFLGILAMLARPIGGDFLHPDAVAQSGGYFGGLAAAALAALLGSAAPVAVGFVILAGVVLCLEAPVAELAAKAFSRAKEFASERTKDEAPASEEEGSPRTRRAVLAAQSREPVRGVEPEPIDVEPRKAPAPTPEPAPARKQSRIVEKELSEPALPELRPAGPYTLPPLSLLTAPAAKPRRNQAEIQKNIEILETTLEQFGVEANVVEVATGPSLTRFEIQLGPGIRVNKITQLADNIAMSLSAHHVRVEAPIPGKAAIGVEVPNPNRTAVTLREMCDSLEFHQNEGLIMALGKDVAGEAEYGDLTKMPHLLIGGATNSGKSIGLAAIIMSLILRHTPKEVRMVMIDPKRVELSLFDGIPHLMYPVVKDTSEAPGVLRAIVREMERRYEQIEERGVRNIDGWNKKVDREERLPYIVVIVDELADLMMQARAEVEAPIIRIGQKARAVGIHMILATQRPSVDVITGLMKANIPSRIAFSVGSQVDSRTILDSGGAERLMGRGDMLFRPVDGGRMTRIQGCYVSEQEIEDVCRHWKMQEKPLYTLNPIQAAIEEKEGEFREQAASDPLWEEVVNWVVERGEASTSMIQRRFSIGFQRASRLLDMMEERGVVGPREGPRPRQVLIDITQIDMILGRSSNLPPVPPGEYVGDD